MNGDICPTCGLPKDLCACKVIEREGEKIKIYVTFRKFRKAMTIVEGIDKKSGKAISKKLKRMLACGGTYKEGRIELQGNHIQRAKEMLIKLGFDEEQIELS